MRRAAELLEQVLETPTALTERPLPAPGDLRPSWRLAALVLLLDRCYGKSATMEQVQVVGWAMLGEESRKAVASLKDTRPLPDVPIVRFDPSWSRTVDLAVGLSLASWTDTGRVELTTSGKAAAKALWEAEGVLDVERAFLRELRVSQAMVDRMLARATS